MPTVSVVMSVYNADRFLREAITSILAQTYTDLEFIIVNDGSTDRSESIVRSFAAQDTRIRVLSRENRGLAASLNEGIAAARGDYIARMDADDVSVPTRLAIQVSAIARLNVDVLGGAIKYVGGAGDGRVEQYPLTDADIKFRMLIRSPFAHPAVIAKADVLKANRYSTDATRGQDYELWTRLAVAGIRFANVPDICVLYKYPLQVHVDEQFEVALRAAVTFGEQMYGLPSQFMRALRTELRAENIRSEDALMYSVALAKIGNEYGVTPIWVERALFAIARRTRPSGLVLFRARARIREANPRATSARLTLLYLLKALPFSTSQVLVNALKG